MRRALTNHFLDCRLINIEPETPGGPYLVVQEGYAPADPAFVDRVFFLRQDGCWVEEMALVSLAESLRFEIIFDHLDRVMETLAALDPARPNIAAREVSEEAVREYLARLEVAGSMEQLARQFLRDYRASRSGLR